MIGAGLAIGLGCIGAGAGIGNAAAGASEAVGRNPNAQGKIMMTMMVGMAMAESIAIYSLVVALILLFVNPFKDLVLG
ncbi:MAG: ATP synthase F0 subunit C [Syntrophaceae bacterium]